MKKITLAVLFGGSSTEYEISLQSAHAVLTHLDRDRYEPVLLGITRDGRWLLYQGPVDALLDDTWHTDARHTVPAVISPDHLHRLWPDGDLGIAGFGLRCSGPVRFQWPRGDCLGHLGDR